MSGSKNKAQNLQKAEKFVQEAAAKGTDIAVLPEMFCCEYKNSAFIENKEPAGGLVHSTLARLAKDNHIYLVGGSMPEEDGEKIYNTSFVFDRSGNQIARHRKMHLFDIRVDGGQSFCESDTFSAGEDITVFDTEFGKMGLIICFDIRFPELTRLEAFKGAQAVFVPAAFNMTTGPAHWELSFRSRALDNQVFMVGCAPARDENAFYVSYANSIVTGPWGDVLARAGAGEEMLYAELNLREIPSVRRQLPLLSARRTDIYTLKEG